MSFLKWNNEHISNRFCSSAPSSSALLCSSYRGNRASKWTGCSAEALLLLWCTCVPLVLILHKPTIKYQSVLRHTDNYEGATYLSNERVMRIIRRSGLWYCSFITKMLIKFCSIFDGLAICKGGPSLFLAMNVRCGLQQGGKSTFFLNKHFFKLWMCTCQALVCKSTWGQQVPVWLESLARLQMQETQHAEEMHQTVPTSPLETQTQGATWKTQP